VEFFEAWFHGNAYQKHRHDRYAICLTITSVLAFHYRGSKEIGTPGQVVALHPDEVHDGFAATPEGFLSGADHPPAHRQDPQTYCEQGRTGQHRDIAT
jgi:quercetin dioxygenase-like cupin family protein